MPFDGAVEEPGQGVRAIIDGAEARLGSPAFCGVADGRAHRRPGRFDDRLPPCAADSAVLAVRQTLRPDAADDRRGAARARARAASSCRATAPEAVAPVAAALGIADWRGGLKPADKIAAHRSA